MRIAAFLLKERRMCECNAHAPFLACNGAMSILVRAAKPLDCNLPFTRTMHVATVFENNSFFVARERAKQKERSAGGAVDKRRVLTSKSPA